MTADQIIAGIIEREGGYVDHPSDRGGPTCWGITEAVARANGWTGPMRDLPKAVAESIYRRRYWTGPGFDRVAAVSGALAEELADTGVNMGPVVAAIWFQRWLNGMNRRGRDYSDMFVDGAIGPVTIAALRSFLRVRGAEGERVLLVALNCSQGHRYLELAELREQNEDFLYGWARERIALPAPEPRR